MLAVAFCAGEDERSVAELHAAAHEWGLGDILWDPVAMARRGARRASARKLPGPPACAGG